MPFNPLDLLSSLGVSEPVPTRAVLKVNGKEYSRWKSLSINRSIVQIAGEFSFTTSNRFSGDNAKWNITTGDECEISIADQVIITGYIDEIDDGYDLNSHDITFSGRDKTADLVDCSYDISPTPELRSVGSFPYYPPAGNGEMKNLSFFQIIEKMCKQVDVKVVLNEDLIAGDEFTGQSILTPIPVFLPNTGAAFYEDISFLCQQRGVLPLTHGDGTLYLTRAGTEKANDKLEVGVNIKSNRLSQSDRDRYSVYYVEGKANKATAFTTKVSAKGKLTDDYVKRFKPKWILDGEIPTDDLCQKRAAWEARIRAGTSRKIGPTVVKGWTQSNGIIWPLNGIVQIKDDKIGVDDSFLIAGISLDLDSSGGELTSISSVPLDTFLLKERVPVPNKKKTAFDKN